jgi:hydrogenase-4 component H
MWRSKIKELIFCLKAGRVTLPYPLDRKEPGLGFRGRPVLDGEKCLGCGACAQVCPPRLISVVDDGNTRNVEVDYSRCTYCARCQDVCPAGAIKLSSDFEMATGDKKDLKLTAVLKMAHCTKCGAPLMTQKMLDKLANEFSPSWLPVKEEPPEWFTWCPSCRRKDETRKFKGGCNVG